MTALFVILGIVGWFAFGILYAPRAAAFAYKHRCHYWREEAAHMWYWWCIFTGPIVVVLQLIWFTVKSLYYPISSNGESRVKMALVKYDDDYRKTYLADQEYRIAQLEQENARLTKSVLNP